MSASSVNRLVLLFLYGASEEEWAEKEPGSPVSLLSPLASRRNSRVVWIYVVVLWAFFCFDEALTGEQVFGFFFLIFLFQVWLKATCW